ncbi:MAG: thioredoxin [Deltaproteobacteria bacterium]|nr:MAG: thioredoxin [Deltaproteobacteria bacterium]
MNSIVIACSSCGTKNRIPADKQHLGPKCGSCKTAINLADSAVPVELDDTNFSGFISQASKPVMVDFFSPTCGPCRMLAPTIDTMAKKFFGRLIIAKLDTSQNQMAAAQYKIRGVPTLLFFKDNQLVDQVTGALPEQDLAQHLEKFV